MLLLEMVGQVVAADAGLTLIAAQLLNSKTLRWRERAIFIIVFFAAFAFNVEVVMAEFIMCSSLNGSEQGNGNSNSCVSDT